MIQSKLILIDGITGSGKSTTAQFLFDQMQRNGIEVSWYHEDEKDHPIKFDEELEVFETQAQLERFLDMMPRLWRDFTQQTMESESVQILESSFFQDSVRLLFQSNVDKQRIIDFLRAVERAIAPLDPVLIYFHQRETEAAIKRIWKRRGPEWKQWFIDLDMQTPYVKRSGLTGEDGVIGLWADYQMLTDQLVESFPHKKLSIENTAGDWPEYRSRILNFLALDFVDPLKGRGEEALEIYCGHYREIDGDISCEIKRTGKGLVCDLIWPDIRILPDPSKEKHRFYLESFPVSLDFGVNEHGSIHTLLLSGGRAQLDGRTLHRTS
jgi:thymidylate kinase